MKNNHKKLTLMSWTKEELAEHIICLEHNNAAMRMENENMYRNAKSVCDSIMTINKWIDAIHENAIKHGWYDNGKKNFGELLMLIVTEVAEVMEEYRNGKGFRESYTDENGKMCGIPSELADIVIRVMDLCGYYKIDLEQAIKDKHEYNKSRPYKHGGKKC